MSIQTAIDVVWLRWHGRVCWLVAAIRNPHNPCVIAIADALLMLFPIASVPSLVLLCCSLLISVAVASSSLPDCCSLLILIAVAPRAARSMFITLHVPAILRVAISIY